MTPIQTIIQLRQELKEYFATIPAIAGIKAVTFFKDNFTRQGWVYDARLNRWIPRKKSATRNQGRQLLISSGRLRRSIRIVEQSNTFVRIGTDVPYAQAHNEGAVLRGSVSVRQHARQYRGKSTIVKQHTRQQNTTIPQRQFLGESPDVIKSVERELFQAITTITSKLK